MSNIEPFAAYEKLFAPVKEMNEIALLYTTKLAELNMAAMRKQTEAVFAGWRDVLAVKDAEGLESFIKHQSEVARSLIEGYVADANTLAQLGKETSENIRKMMEENIAAALKKAA